MKGIGSYASINPYASLAFENENSDVEEDLELSQLNALLDTTEGKSNDEEVKVYEYWKIGSHPAVPPHKSQEIVEVPNFRDKLVKFDTSLWYCVGVEKSELGHRFIFNLRYNCRFFSYSQNKGKFCVNFRKFRTSEDKQKRLFPNNEFNSVQVAVNTDETVVMQFKSSLSFLLSQTADQSEEECRWYVNRFTCREREFIGNFQDLGYKFSSSTDHQSMILPGLTYIQSSYEKLRVNNPTFPAISIKCFDTQPTDRDFVNAFLSNDIIWLSNELVVSHTMMVKPTFALIFNCKNDEYSRFKKRLRKYIRVPFNRIQHMKKEGVTPELELLEKALRVLVASFWKIKSPTDNFIVNNQLESFEAILDFMCTKQKWREYLDLENQPHPKDIWDSIKQL